MTKSNFPPSTFNVIGNAFRPTGGYDRIEGFAEKVFDLMKKGRFRSALDEILKVLDHSPEHEEALRMAMFVFGGSKTEHLQALEPITEVYTTDPRFDPIFAVCSNCKVSTWSPTNCLYDGQVSVTNPLGLQCYNCGYVLCRECYLGEHVSQGVVEIGRVCTNCSASDLRPVVFPTGRSPMRMMRDSSARKTQIFIFREGPVRPDIDYIQELLGRLCPDALKDGVEITSSSIETWPDNIDTYCTFFLLASQEDGRLKGNLWDAERISAIDSQGAKVYMGHL